MTHYREPLDFTVRRLEEAEILGTRQGYIKFSSVGLHV